MFNFNYENFKGAQKEAGQENHNALMDDIEKVKAFVEKGLTMFLESSANRANTNYPGVEL